ncbi:MAG: methyltransferase domain-containing protein [Ilumatobacteraceae bacterium]
MKRYAHLGVIYDVISLEVFLYRRPRKRLCEIVGPMPGATVVDVGCGTGLNLSWLHQAVSPGGRVIGLDSSPSMLAAAQRRISRHGWSGVDVIRGEISRLDDVLAAADIAPDAFVATFVLSLLDDVASFWAAVEGAATTRPIQIALADLGVATEGPRVVRVVLAALAALGGGRRSRRPWQRLATLDPDMIHESLLLGHVHLAAGSVRGVTQP